MLTYFREIRSKRVLITFHSLADVDAVGSAFALKSYFPKAQVVAPDTVNSRAKRLMKLLSLKLDEEGPYDALIVLDTHSKRLLGRFGAKKADIVIDHHLKQESIDAKHAVIDKSYSSTCEIIYGLLRELRVKIDKKAAACLLAGIISDSAGFKNASARTFKCTSELMELSNIDYEKLLLAIEPRLDVSQRTAVLKAAQRCKFERVGDHLLAFSSVNSNESLAAEALVELGADAAFVAYAGEDARISGRMSEELEGKLNLAPIMAEAGKVLGGDGGGHEMAAGANGPRIDFLDDALDLCVELAKRKLKGER